MLIQILGAIDIIIAISSLLMAYGLYFKSFIVIAASYLVAKGLILFSSIASIMDIIIGIILIIAVFWAVHPLVLGLIFLILLQKGIFSFL